MIKVKVSTKSSPVGSDSQDDCGADEVLFWINKSGFPLSEHVWDRMFEHASKLHPTGQRAVMEIKNTLNPSPVSIPRPPINVSVAMSAERRVELAQNYMRDLQYNHTGTQFYDIKKYKTMSGHTEVAKEMIKESLPIKCLEAVILGIYLTNGIPGLERYPMSFRSIFGSNIHRHVVLVVNVNGLFGTIGMSRREDLMYKPLQYTSLSDLVIDYIECYHQYWHKVDKVKIGFPVSHDPQSHEPIHWKGLAINPSKMTQPELKQAVDKHSKDIRMWVRQAPIGATYVPRSQATNYPPLTMSQTSPYKSKTHTHNSHSHNMRDSESVTATGRSSTSLSHTTSNHHNKRNKSFEMRI